MQRGDSQRADDIRKRFGCETTTLAKFKLPKVFVRSHRDGRLPNNLELLELEEEWGMLGDGYWTVGGLGESEQ
jgi:hypothetical protein